jgi:nickel/cobalt transporter (NicO) family protein
MNHQRGLGRRQLRLLPLLGLIALLSIVLAPSKAALAHPLDIFLQASYITVAPTQIVVELDLTPGVLVAPQELTELDSDGDQQITDAERQAYAAMIVGKIVLQVDGQPQALTVTEIDMPEYLTIQAGYGTIRIFTVATLADGMSDSHQVSYANTYAPTGSAYQVNAFVENGAEITLGKQIRDEIQQTMTMNFAIGNGGVAAESSDAETEARSDATGQARRLLAYLDAPAMSFGTLVIALALAVMLGGLHALTPGHGKTLVAAYLVGSRGTVRHAVALGGIVTFTHTASVVVIGLLALFASQFIVPNVLVPMLQVLSGVLVVWMGTRLAWQRWSAVRRRREPEPMHGHDHDHLHDHGDGHVHSHLPPAEGFKARNLVALGVSGGLVPCPEALGIMIIAVGLNRIVLGLGLIVSFSVGLAAVLIGIGILLVRSRSLVERFGGLGGRWSKLLPVGSAVIVTVLGVGITLRGLADYLG